MKLYKILVKRGNKYYSPFQSYCYGKLDDFLGKEMVCGYFNDNKKIDCSSGFYATKIDGLIYTNMSRKGSVVFKIEVSGDNVKFDQFKWRWEKQKFIRKLGIVELKRLVKEYSDTLDWNYYNALFPVNPLKRKTKEVKEEHIVLLKQWGSIWDSIRGSIWGSIRGSIWDSIQASIGDSIGASVWGSIGSSIEGSVGGSVDGSVGAYTSSLFPNIKKWKYIEHEEGINPFQPAIDLWHAGFVPSFDGTTWRLHSGKNAEIVFEYKENN